MNPRFDWYFWALAIVGSILIHAGASVGLKLPKAGAVENPAGAPVSVTGSLASILGAQQSEPVEVEATTTETEPVEASESEKLPPLQPAETEVAKAQPVEALEGQKPRVARSPPTPKVEAVSNVASPETLAARSTTDSLVTTTVAPEPVEVISPAPQPANSIKSNSTEAPPREVEPAREVKPKKIKPRPDPETKREEIKRQQRKRELAEKRRSQRAERRRRKARREKEQREARRKSRSGSNRQGAAGNARGGKRGRSRAGAGAVSSYATRVRSRILANRPSSIGSGRAVISFGVSSVGGLRYARVSSSSGNSSFDRAALAAVRRSSPFPRPPAGASAGQLRFSIAFSSR